MTNYIFIFCTENYPDSFSANNTKISIIAKELSLDNNSVTIINNPKYSTKEGKTNIENVEVYNIGAPISINKKRKFLLKILKEKYSPNSLNFLFTNCGSCINHYLTLTLGKKIGYKIGYIYQEWHWKLDKSIKGKINTLICDCILIKKYDFILPISEFLINKIRNLKIPYFKFPILDRIDNISIQENNKDNDLYFVYCASTGYTKVIDFVIDSFALFIKNFPEYKLRLVLSGNLDIIEKYNKIIDNNCLNKNIIIHTKLPYKELKQIYTNAIGLIIPLQPNNTAEHARFSQKTAEYLSTGNPIITTDVGEMSFYFTHKKTAYIVNYTIEDFSNTYKEIVLNRNLAKTIGYNGYLLAKEKFNAKNIARNLNTFLNTTFKE